MAYAFGDSGLAAQRLELLADTFAESSRVFVRESVQGRPAIVADLGCGPGLSTQLLANTLSPDHTIGLDNSKSFIHIAQNSASEKVSFHLHDITTVPFPVGSFDLLFSRFELTHLRNPEEVLKEWGMQLMDGGLLLLEEVEHIAASATVLQEYLELQQAMLLARGNSLYIGSEIDSIGESATLKRRSSRVQTVRVPARRAAEMFHMNLNVWRHDDFVKDNYGHEVLDRIGRDLLALSLEHVSTGPVEWGLRQIVMERAGSS